MNFHKQVRHKDFYREFVELANAFFDLSNREKDVLAVLFKIDTEWEEKNIISTKARKYIMEETLINPFNLSTYISKYKSKNILAICDDGNGWEIDPRLKLEIEDGMLTFLVQLKDLDYE